MGSFNVAPPPYLDYDDTDVMSPLNPMNIAAYGMLRPRNPGVEAPDISAPPPTPNSAPVDMAGSLPQAPVYVPGVNAPKTPDDTYADAMSELEAAYGQRPQMPAPKWWQRLGGAAAGFGAGWSNASGRTRNPINIGAMEQSILEPGYNESLQRWQQNTLAPAQTKAEIEGAKQAAWWKSKQLQAQAEELEGRGAYYKHRAELEQNQWKIDPKTGTIYNTITGEVNRPPASQQDRFDIAKKLGADDGMATFYALNGNLNGYGSTLANPQPTKPGIVLPPGGEYIDPNTGAVKTFNPREFKPDGAGEKTPGPKDFTKLEVNKNTKLAQAEAGARKRIAAGDDPDQVYKDLNNEKQQIQNDYESENATLGGKPQHFEYGTQSTTGKGSKTAPPKTAQAPTPKTRKPGTLKAGPNNTFTYIPG